MRFPFTFMGALSLLFGAWVGAYTLLHRPADTLTLALELISTALLLGFGGYVIYRRLARRSAA